MGFYPSSPLVYPGLMKILQVMGEVSLLLVGVFVCIYGARELIGALREARK